MAKFRSTDLTSRDRHTPGAMGEGNWTAAAYIDQRANDQQTAALGAIFGGAEGGPMAAFAH